MTTEKLGRIAFWFAVFSVTSIVVFGVFLAAMDLTGASEQRCPEFDPNGVKENAVLNQLVSAGLESGAATNAEADENTTKVACVRRWAHTLPDKCLASIYYNWLDAYDLNIHDAREYIVRNKLALHYAATHPLPSVPPSLSR